MVCVIVSVFQLVSIIVFSTRMSGSGETTSRTSESIANTFVLINLGKFLHLSCFASRHSISAPPSSSVVKHIGIGAGGMGFDSRAG